MPTESITGVPSDKVEVVIRDYKDSGASELRVEKQDNGTYTITAVFGDLVPAGAGNWSVKTNQ
jgi:hypothetical protein